MSVHTTLREDIRRIMREGIGDDTNTDAAQLMREVVQWASTHPENYMTLLSWVYDKEDAC